jgi:hypothetical protein
MTNQLRPELKETVEAFIGAIEGPGKKKADRYEIESQMVARLKQDYEDPQNQQLWPKVRKTVLAFVRLGGRLAAASVKDTVTWNEARPALKAVQDECIAMRESEADERGRHCRSADFVTP